MDWYIQHQSVRYWRPSVNFCHGNVSADAPVKGTLLALITKTLTICNGETCRVDDLLYSAAHNMSNFITQLNCLG